MNHEEAVKEMATERYLLDELSPERRDAFEEHMFECQDCAFDVRAGNVFLEEAKVQLPQILAASAPEPARQVRVQEKQPWWRILSGSFLKPAFAMPVFAALLAVIAVQNLATIPSLRSAATQPRIMPWTSVHAGTRGTEPTVVQADPKQGAVILIDLPQQPAYATYVFDLLDPQGKRFWTQTVAAPGESNAGAGALSLLIPGAKLQTGSYTLTIAGVSSQGARTELGRRALDVHLGE